MPTPKDTFNNGLHFKFDYNIKVVGLDTFKKSLEKDFFSEVTVRCCTPDETMGNLIIGLDCNFGLHEILYYLENGSWGSNLHKDTEERTSLFLQALSDLREQNQLQLDIKEFSIFLNDTTIIINKIWEQSIPDQLENIFTKIAEHYVYFTKGLTEIPFEIYVSVFEEDLFENDTFLEIDTENDHEKSFYRYWGLYFDSEDDAVIYDLARKSIVSGDLYMLNH